MTFPTLNHHSHSSPYPTRPKLLSSSQFQILTWVTAYLTLICCYLFVSFVSFVLLGIDAMAKQVIYHWTASPDLCSTLHVGATKKPQTQMESRVLSDKELGMVVHICNLRNSVGYGRRIPSLRSASKLGETLSKTLFQKKIKKGLGCGSSKSASSSTPSTKKERKRLEGMNSGTVGWNRKHHCSIFSISIYK